MRLEDSPQARGYDLYLCLQVRAWGNIESIFRVLALIFEALEELVPGNQISLAANSLSGDALGNWHRLAVRPTTWKIYEAATRSFM